MGMNLGAMNMPPAPQAASKGSPAQAPMGPQSGPSISQGPMLAGMPGSAPGGSQGGLGMGLGASMPGAIAALRAATPQMPTQQMQFRTLGNSPQAGYRPPAMGARAMSSADWQRQQMQQPSAPQPSMKGGGMSGFPNAGMSAMPSSPQASMKGPAPGMQQARPSIPASRIGFDPVQR